MGSVRGLEEVTMIENALRNAAPFRDLGPTALAEIARRASERQLTSGEAMFNQGDPAERFFLVVEGRLKVTMIVPDGKQVLVRLIFPGDFCGLTPVLTISEYPATARAIVASRAVTWPTSFWPTLIEMRPGLALGLTQALGRHLAEAHTRIAELSTAEVERRVASAVLRLADRAGEPVEGGGVRIDFPVTRQDIAELTGTTLHSVSRIISAWVTRGIVGRGRARLIVRDVPALERIAEGHAG